MGNPRKRITTRRILCSSTQSRKNLIIVVGKIRTGPVKVFNYVNGVNIAK